MSPFRIDANVELHSDWLPDEVFSTIFDNRGTAVATAIEGVEDPETQEVRVVDTVSGEVVWRSTDEEYE